MGSDFGWTSERYVGKEYAVGRFVVNVQSDGIIRISLEEVPMVGFCLLPLDFRGQTYPFAYNGVEFPFHVRFDCDLASVSIVIVEHTGTVQQDTKVIENHCEAFTLSLARLGATWGRVLTNGWNPRQTSPNSPRTSGCCRVIGAPWLPSIAQQRAPNRESKSSTLQAPLRFQCSSGRWTQAGRSKLDQIEL